MAQEITLTLTGYRTDEVLPKCPTCGAQMVYRPSRAKAEAYCGVWYDCHNGKCA